MQTDLWYEDDDGAGRQGAHGEAHSTHEHLLIDLGLHQRVEENAQHGAYVDDGHRQERVAPHWTE